jgi:hypothetical protein
MGHTMKKSPAEFYSGEIKIHAARLKDRKKQLALSSALRLFVFILICIGVYLTFGNTALLIPIIVIGIALFIFMVSRHSDLQYKHDLLKSLIAINERELEVLNRNFKHLPNGSQFMDPNHEFSQDIDLFGRGSFYQYMNRTALESGSSQLAALLLENNCDRVEEKQKAIKELSNLSQWRQHFSAVASLVKAEVSGKNVISWLNAYKNFVPSNAKFLSRSFSLISAGLIIAYFTGFLSGYILFGWFLLGLTISGVYLKQINMLSAHTSAIQSTFQQFHKLVLEIENKEFAASLLSEKRTMVLNSEHRASAILKQFAKHLDALDQRNNMLVGIIANGFMLRDLAISKEIENWIAHNSTHVESWFGVIAFFDAYNSLANYAFNHPGHTFPEISDSETVLNATGAGHPLLDPENLVRNDLTIHSEEFFIVTGANMAGKSTFLRTVSLLIVMGNTGLPVCAEYVRYNPVKLITSMRTSDSLTDDESYFFSELKRLKFIVEKIHSDRYFIILDEILKGTNSTDKAAGSRKFVEKLVAGNSTGIIATHDLSLCAVADDLPEVKNYYFDARIEDGELYFDYLMAPGICQNMNASFLLKKMKIVD